VAVNVSAPAAASQRYSPSQERVCRATTRKVSELGARLRTQSGGLLPVTWASPFARHPNGRFHEATA
jgi:hypothetical protein